jgi:hypothetical protein
MIQPEESIEKKKEIQNIITINGLLETWAHNLGTNYTFLTQNAESLEKFKGMFKNQSVMITSSGPSFNEHYKKLKDWEGLLFCTYSQAPLLNELGLKPKFIFCAEGAENVGERMKYDTHDYRGSYLVVPPFVEPNILHNFNGDGVLLYVNHLSPVKDIFGMFIETSGIMFPDVTLFPLVGPSVHYAVLAGMYTSTSRQFLLGFDLYYRHDTERMHNHNAVGLTSKKKKRTIYVHGIKTTEELLANAETLISLSLFYNDVKFYETGEKSPLLDGVFPFVSIESVLATQGTVKKGYPEFKELVKRVKAWRGKFNSEKDDVVVKEPDVEETCESDPPTVT